MNRNRLALAAAVALALAPAAATADILARIRFEVTDLADNPISSINVGEDFRLRALVQDLRPPGLANGVAAAYLNGDYDETLASTVATAGPGADPAIVFGSFFGFLRTGELSPAGDIVAAGAASLSLSPPGSAEQFLFHVPFQADAPGVVTFTPSFDSTPGHEVLIYLEDEALAPNEILFVSDSLTIVPEPSTLALAGMAAMVLAILFRRGRAKTPTC
jgi:hypothetical protein